MRQSPCWELRRLDLGRRTVRLGFLGFQERFDAILERQLRLLERPTLVGGNHDLEERPIVLAELDPLIRVVERLCESIHKLGLHVLCEQGS